MKVSRRELGSALFGAAAAACEAGRPPEEVRVRAPSVFVGHGAPTLALDAKGIEMERWGAGLRPRALLVVSAHWTTRGVATGAERALPLVYDFHGFPDALYRLRYEAPGAPDLARRVRSLLASRSPGSVAGRGLDHGVWVPLLRMFPKADLPVLQLSLPVEWSPAELIALGRDLAPLRGDGVMLIGSGNMTHNLGRIAADGAPVPAWASEFDQWATETVERWDLDALADYRSRAPQLRINHPTEEHWQPLLVAVGAAGTSKPRLRWPIQGFEHGSLSRRCLELA
jgi:4,5-DOPA dioxygenase extradiol